MNCLEQPCRNFERKFTYATRGADDQIIGHRNIHDIDQYRVPMLSANCDRRGRGSVAE